MRVKIYGGLSVCKLEVYAIGKGHLARAEKELMGGEDQPGEEKKKGQGGVEQKEKEEKKEVGPTRKIQESELEGVNYYELLGLDAAGVGVDDEMIKRAYHKALLLYHPDKTSGSTLDAQPPDNKEKKKTDSSEESDAVFLAVQKAYGILSDEQKRRAYDSTNEFDESIPTGRESEEPEFDFYQTYGPVFRRNGRFAVKQPVPELGSDKDDENTVEKFYEYWTRFESWRDFGLEAREHDPDQAEDRFEKRWMAKENDKLAKKRKREEYARIVALVERARANDPRLKKFAFLKAEQKRLLKAKKDDAELAKKVAFEAAQFLHNLVEEQKAQHEQVLAKERKAQRDKLKKAKRRAEKALFAIIADARKVVDPTRVMDDDTFASLVSELDPEELVELSEKLVVGSSDDAADGQPPNHRPLMEAVQSLQKALDQKRANPTQKLKVVVPTKDLSASSRSLKAAPWSDDELSMLAKCVKRFPAGAKHRWETVADYLSDQLKLTVPRTKDECIAMYQQLQSTPKSDLKRQPRQQQEGGGGAGGSTANNTSSSGWTDDQQKQLERGLAKYPATLEANERWKKIASEVSGKTKKECVERYKHLRAALAASK